MRTSTHGYVWKRSAEAVVLATCVVLLSVGFAPHGLAQMGLRAIPSFHRVPLLESSDHVRIAPSVGYGFFESVYGASDRHQRVFGAAAASVSTRMGLSAELRIDARYDTHVDDSGSDSGGVLDPRGTLRYTHALSERVAGALQMTLWVPGEDAPSPAFDATTLDLVAAIGVAPSETLRATLSAGYRHDRSARSVSRPERLRQSDWIALGLSDSDALLWGLGLGQQWERASWFAEVTWDMLLGSSAPSLGGSPARLSVGGSQALSESGKTRATLVGQLLVSGRAPVDVTGALSPFEPRVALMVGLSQDFTWGDEPVAVVEPEPKPEPVVVEPEPVEVTPPAPRLPAGVLRVMVRDGVRGESLTARVRVTTPQADDPTVGDASTEDGVLELELAPGSYEVEIGADGFLTQRRRISIDEEGVTVINIDLRTRRNP
jgi:hypothetical protein